MKKFLVYITQSELFKTEVEAVDENAAISEAEEAFSRGEYSETGSTNIEVGDVEEIEEVVED
ncbi:TPA: hypothetical protein DIU22_00875 [Candidatus Woesebacteria bacterium]|nr:hypothetical protein [Candidatus Woesebacteria bacterium]